jgi:hypothetical protein
MSRNEHPSRESVLAWATGRTPAAGIVPAHLESCPACRGEAGDWSQLGAALSSWSQSLPAPRPLAVPPPAVRAARRDTAARAWHAATVVAAQVPVVRRRVWAATAVVAGLGCLVVAATGAAAGTVLALTAPVSAALGMAIIYGPDSDPCAEISRSCPVPPRTILLSRLLVVAGYDLAVAFGATFLLAGTGASVGVWSVITAWLGPLLVMSALSVLLSVVFRSSMGLVAALVLWALRVVTLSPAHLTVLAAATSWVWVTTPVTAVVTTLALAAAVMAVGRKENWHDRRPLGA